MKATVSRPNVLCHGALAVHHAQGGPERERRVSCARQALVEQVALLCWKVRARSFWSPTCSVPARGIVVSASARRAQHEVFVPAMMAQGVAEVQRCLTHRRIPTRR